MRILTGYLQSILMVKYFDFNWPTKFRSLLNRTSFFLSPDLLNLSMDCIFLRYIESQGSPPAPLSEYFQYVKIGLIAVTPIFTILLTSLSVLFFKILQMLIKRRMSKIDFTETVKVLLFVAGYVMQP